MNIPTFFLNGSNGLTNADANKSPFKKFAFWLSGTLPELRG